MGFFDNLRRNMPGAPRSIANHLLKYYLMDVTKYPDWTSKEIFKKILKDRYANFKKMSNDDIDRVVAKTDNLVELTIAVIAHENPASMSPHYEKETFTDILNFYKEKAPLEFEKFIGKVESIKDTRRLEERKRGEISKSWLQKKITLQEAETTHLVKDDRLGPKPIPFGFVNGLWKAMIAKMKEGDELWEFCSPDESWQDLAGREGIALIRNRQVIDYILTRMN